ncbi:MAG: zinc ribbon domain-containing protein [Veillonella sp.]|uniref:hypothetical protein n=1 Tax=Veillonella sp. TaxID=1926307 RepID=UPI0025CB8BB6|nr:hypothetical protein [Veillonella sp.]MBS4913150.1 zinc ribbon domain-containing protein [Veillonella sp.]
MKCEKCGHEQPQGKFCKKCGGKLVESVAPVADLQSTATTAVPSSAAAASNATPVPPVAPAPQQAMGTQGKIYQRRDGWQIFLGIVLIIILSGTSWFLTFRNMMEMGSTHGMMSEYGLDLDESKSKDKKDVVKEEPKEQTKTQAQTTQAPDPRKVDAENAQKAFNQYHQYITARNYNAAYALFTDNLKNQSGELNAWAQGFATTKESAVANMTVVSQTDNQVVLNYRLDATDFEGSGTVKRSFRGTATMVKVNNQWFIDSMQASQM